MNNNSLARRIIRWGLYPASWAWILLALWYVLHIDADERPAWVLITIPLALLYLVLEVTFPMDRRWSMTWKNLLPDIAYIGLSGATVSVITAGLAMVSITIAGREDGLARDWPMWLQIPVIFLVFEFLNYHLHRWMHELRGVPGRILWNIHAAHHLPDRLYLMMHAVLHPFNAVLVQAVAIILPIWIMGYQPEVVLIFLVINAFHGIISHFNVDLRMGWANYIFVGPEVHRYHHSADMSEAKNYGSTLTLWDQIFGTFIYRPGTRPQELGTEPASNLPEYRNVPAVLLLPFGLGKKRSA